MGYDYNTHGFVTCPNCGKNFMSDCGVDYCSSSCETEWEYNHEPCSRCGFEVGEDSLNSDRVCEECEVELELEEGEE